MDLNAGAELGDFLRTRRGRLTPESVGLPGGRRRRTPGLRREEVAQLAGIGVDWYIRLEQGRTVSPSAATVKSLARALRLDTMEEAHLRALSRHSVQPPFEREVVPEALRRTVEALNLPAYVTGRRFDVLAWNAAAADVFEFDRIDETDRNTLILVLTSPATRALFGGGWSAEARRMVAKFRSTFDLFAHDAAFVSLAERLRTNCPEFAGWWESHDLSAAVSGRKHLHHPRLGALRLTYASFQANDNPNLKLIIYTPDSS